MLSNFYLFENIKKKLMVNNGCANSRWYSEAKNKFGLDLQLDELKSDLLLSDVKKKVFELKNTDLPEKIVKKTNIWNSEIMELMKDDFLGKRNFELSRRTFQQWMLQKYLHRIIYFGFVLQGKSYYYIYSFLSVQPWGLHVVLSFAF